MIRNSARLLQKITLAAIVLVIPGFPCAGRADDKVTLTGQVVDGSTAAGGPLPCRLYIRSDDGAFFTCESAEKDGGAISFDKRCGPTGVEVHTCLSSHPFQARLSPGKYELTEVRGHEYLPAKVEVRLEKGRASEVTLELHRWIDMAGRGWFSGDTRCHRTEKELAIVLPAEDLNVTFPLTSWVTDTTQAPANDSKTGKSPTRAELVKIDDSHVYWPVNTGYEPACIDGKPHPPGAFLVLNHREPLDIAAPPVPAMEKAAREPGVLIGVDEHSWPWLMMLPKAMRAQLFELAGNHGWRTDSASAGRDAEHVPGYMQIPLKGPERDIDERGWLEFGLRTWYALLNTGLRLMPSAGAASGMRPAPLGFARVYARLGDRGFDYEEWIKALREGRTFVTTGPMLFTVVGEKHPGGVIDWEQHLKAVRAARKETAETDKKGEKESSTDRKETAKNNGEKTGSKTGVIPDRLTVLCRVESSLPIRKLKIVVNGKPRSLEIGGPIGARAPHSCFARAEVEIERSSWIASRVFTETPEGRVRFAHTAPVWVEVKDKPLAPNILETDYLKKRVETELEEKPESAVERSPGGIRGCARVFQQETRRSHRK